MCFARLVLGAADTAMDSSRRDDMVVVGMVVVRVSAYPLLPLCVPTDGRRTTDERTHEKFEIEMKVQSAGPGAGGKLNVIRARWKFTVNGNDAKAVGAGVGTEKSTEDQQSAAGFLG